MNQVIVRNTFAAASALLLAFAPVGSARAATAGEAAGGAAEESGLRPGEFVWQPERAAAGEVEIVVSLPLQRAYVYRGGTLIGVSTVSTGRPGHRTPTGRFDILEKRREHYSNLYNNAPMPFMQRLTWSGVALHAGQIPGRPASHGCIRLPLAFARHLFSVTTVGAAVHVIEQAPAPEEALAMVRGDGIYAGMGGPLEEVVAEPAAPGVGADGAGGEKLLADPVWLRIGGEDPTERRRGAKSVPLVFDEANAAAAGAGWMRRRRGSAAGRICSVGESLATNS